MDPNVITTVLHNAQQPQTNKEAESQLQQLEQQNLGVYLTALTGEVVNESKPEHTRRLGTTLLKNRLDSEQNEQKRQQFHKDWLALDINIRNNIKAGLMQALGTPVPALQIGVAQVVAKVALIELPDMWPTLIETLRQNMLPTSTNENLKVSTLHTLGFICEEIDPPVIGPQSNSILSAVVVGMRREETNNAIKVAAAKALDNALEFAKANFEKKDERDWIMQVVCDAITSPEANLRREAYMCLVKIASLYYKELPPYMRRIFDLTLETIQKDSEEVALQAIEFWSTICDEEIYLNQEVADNQAMAGNANANGGIVCHLFIKGALKYLVPLILECLTKQEEDVDEDTWNKAMAGSTCLELIANCVGDDIVGYVVPFVQQYIVNADWHLREAAVMAFGSILEGPTKIAPLIKEALPVLVKHMKDSNELVQDTTAWTLGRISSLHSLALQGEAFNHVMGALVDALTAAPRVATNACWALNNIAEAFRDHHKLRPAPNFDPYFVVTVQKLLLTTEREDADESNLRVSAYEAINAFIQSADTTPSIESIHQLVPIFLERLNNTFSMQIVSSEDRDQQHETQGLLCGLFLTCTSKLEGEIAKYSDAMVQLFIRLFATKSAIVQEEVLMAFGTLVNALETGFNKYMPVFLPYLLTCLRAYEEHQVCIIAHGVVGDICRAFQKDVAQYTDAFATAMFGQLQTMSLNKIVPNVLACFGDMALALCGGFQKYLPMLMNFLGQISTVKFDTSKDEMLDYSNELREAMLDCYTGILQGFRTDDCAAHFLNYAPAVLNYIATLYPDNTRTEAVTRAAVGVVGDIAQSIGAPLKQVLMQDNIRLLLEECANSDDEATMDTARWAQETIAKC